jgi:hypothetical protein
MPVIPFPGRLRQEDGEFEASLGYIVRTKKGNMCACVCIITV